MNQEQLSLLAPEPQKRPRSAFDDLGMDGTVDALMAEIQAIYLADDVPWVVGYSGGKDSSATLQLVWLALARVPAEHRTKPVHVISTDTLVENPIVAQWANGSLEAMRSAAHEQGLCLSDDPDARQPRRPAVRVHRLRPELADTFWVNLIGYGYPAPRHKFRWCTERLKIKPSNAFILDMVSAHGEAILVLGTRKAESTVRAARMEALEKHRVRERLSPNASLPGSLVYSPIENWSNDDVWMFLMQYKNPWGWDNRSLLTLYQGATEGGECPLVVDTSTPSCGASRFGCWVCTLVEQDKSMTAMIQNDQDKEWMLPLLDLRNALDFRDRPDGDRDVRDWRRMNGRVQLMMSGGAVRTIPGPYTQATRADWLRRLLIAQRHVREMGPEEVRRIELISLPELAEIRRIWVVEKHEIEDVLPALYAAATGEPYPGPALEVTPFGAEEMALLRDVCEDEETYRLARDLLDVERQHRNMERRAGLFGALEGVLRRYQFANVEEAIVALGTDDLEADDAQARLPLANPQPIEVPNVDPVERARAVLARVAEDPRLAPLASATAGLLTEHSARR
jgi:DNA sulfur modification protein DndC